MNIDPDYVHLALSILVITLLLIRYLQRQAIEQLNDQAARMQQELERLKLIEERFKVRNSRDNQVLRRSDSELVTAIRNLEQKVEALADGESEEYLGRR